MGHGTLRPGTGSDLPSTSAPVDRDAVPAVGGERLPRPPSVALEEAEARHPRHEVEFARPGVAADDGRHADPPRREGDVALVEALGDGVVAAHAEDDAADGDGL